jgi:tetratricopeptide (TPR) repeat protein
MTEKNMPTTDFQEGMAEFVGGNYEKSIDYFNRVIESDPDSRSAFMSRGSAFLKLNRFDEAKADFDRVIETDRNYARAYHLRGLVYEKTGDDESAMRDFDRAIELDPEYGAAYYSRATLRSKLGQTDQATDDIEMVTHLTQVNIETFANENNVWRSNQLRLEEMGVADPMDR